MHAAALRGRDGAKLAFTRVSFNYFISETVFDYIVEAVHLIANEGWKLLPRYRFDPDSGLWQHATAPARPLPTLDDLGDPLPTAPESALAGQLAEARRILGAVGDLPPRPQPHDRWRWFPLPEEIAVSA